MIRVFLLAALFLGINSYTFSQKVPPQDKAAEQEMLVKSKNGFTIQFTGMRILFADSIAKEFMSQKINMVHADESKKELGNRVLKLYVRYTSRKNIEDEVQFEYVIRPGGDFYYIKDIIIHG